MTKRQRTIGAPFVYMDGKLCADCTINMDALTKKIINIAVGVVNMDSLQSVEYFSGIVTPIWDGWNGTMTEPKIKGLVDRYRKREGSAIADILGKACDGKNIEPGYAGGLLLLTDVDFVNQRLKENSYLKLL